MAAVPAIPFTVTMSEAVNVTGTPRIVLDVGGTTRYATYSSGTGTSSLIFTYTATAGDVDLDGIGIASTTLDLNGGALTDLNGNPETNLTFTAPANMGSVNVNYPSLSMDFIADADGRYSLNGTVYNDLTSFLTASGGTFSRASVGTYFDSTGTLQTAASGTPRFDYDPVTHAAKGILIEESRTNLFTYSSQLDQASWNTRAGSTTIATASTAPDGSVTSYLETKSSGDGYVWKFYNFPASTAYTLSFFVKGGASASTITLHYWDGTAQQNSAAIPISAGQAWTRISFTFTTSASVIPPGDVGFYIGANPFYVWGGQLEQGSFATSYIPTTSATVTRAAEDLIINTGAWFNAALGSIYYNATSCTTSTICVPVAFEDNGNDQMGYMTSGQTSIKLSNSYTINSSGAPANAITGVAGYVNGFSTGGGGFMWGPEYPVNKIRLGSNVTGNHMNSGLKQFKYYPANVGATHLQLMTQ